MRRSWLALAVVGLCLLPVGSAYALSFDDDVTTNVIFGSGNGNGFFTVDRNATEGIELGLRAKIPFNATYNSQGNGDYTFALGTTWNVEWSINSNYNGNGDELDQFTYVLGFDADPTQGVSYSQYHTVIFDPIHDALNGGYYFDHSFGNNSTAQSGGVESANAAEFASNAAQYNLVQQSWRMDQYDAIPGFDVNPNIDGTYTYYLAAFDALGNQIGYTEIDVIIGAGGAPVPEPATMTILGLGLGGLMVGRLRKRRAQLAS